MYVYIHTHIREKVGEEFLFLSFSDREAKNFGETRAGIFILFIYIFVKEKDGSGEWAPLDKTVNLKDGETEEV